MSSGALYRIIAILLMGSMATENYFSSHHSAATEQYHARIRMAGDSVPTRVGPWLGENQPVEVQALTVLRPNVLISRRYINIESGVGAMLLLVHCSDAHHMVGHYPLRCYPAEGWKVRSYSDKDWTVGGINFTGTEYHFTMPADGAGGHLADRSIVVVNCLLRPDGAILRDMESMSKTILGAGGQSSGAGQIQISFNEGVPKAQRDAAVLAITEGCLPVIKSILAKAPS